MKKEDLSDALDHLDQQMIQEADALRQKNASQKPSPRRWRKGGLLAACLCLLLVGAWLLPDLLDRLPGRFGEPAAQEAQTEENKTPAREYMVAEAIYPQMAAYPVEADYTDEKTGEWDWEAYQEAWNAWDESRQKQLAQPEGYGEGLESFFSRSAGQFLGDAQGENRVYSPLNLYMALAMLAEITEGQSRQQVLDLLGAENLGALREQAGALWNAHYCDDGATASILANSLWLDQEIPYESSAVETLAQNYYASVFQGEMGSDAFSQALRDWLNQQTGGLLEEQVQGLELKPETLLALASTIYFKAGWEQEFGEAETREEIFYSPEGEIPCDFLHQSDSQRYYWGNHFSAVSKAFSNQSGRMWFLLPEEGSSPEELLQDPQVQSFLFSGEDWENGQDMTVNLAVPSFDVTSDLDLISGLKELGIRDVFDGNVSDFSPLLGSLSGAAVTQASHAARVMIDEKGCEAAAYTVIMVEESAAMLPEEEVDFVLNRPFLFAIAGADGLPLFVGIVNQPV